MSAPQANEAEKNLEIWKVKKLIKRLEAARGNGTSMISLIIRTCFIFPLLLEVHWKADFFESPQRPGVSSSKDVG